MRWSPTRSSSRSAWARSSPWRRSPAGPWLYRAMGGTGGTLDAALAYSHVIFGGAVAYWLYNTLSAVVRGTGNMALPATVMVANGAIYLALAPPLILGWGPLPRLGVAGAAAASVTVLRARQPRARRLPGLGPEPRHAVARADPARGGSLFPRHPARGRTRLAQHRVHQPHDRPRHRARRPVRSARAGRLRHGGAARVSADPAGIRPRRGARDHGGNQYGRGEPGAGPARGVGRLGTGGAGDGRGRALRRALPSRVARAVQPRRRGARGGGRSISAPSGRSTASSSASGSRSTSPRRAQDGSAGRSSPALRAWRSPAAGASSPCAGWVAGSRRSSR